MESILEPGILVGYTLLVISYLNFFVGISHPFSLTKMPLIKFSNVSFHSMLKVAELPIVIAQKEEILVEYLCCVFGKKWDVLISQEERNIFYLISSNRGCKQPSQQCREVAPENRDQEY